jgi:hypothetical protein
MQIENLQLSNKEVPQAMEAMEKERFSKSEVTVFTILQ